MRAKSWLAAIIFGMLQLPIYAVDYKILVNSDLPVSMNPVTYSGTTYASNYDDINIAILESVDKLRDPSIGAVYIDYIKATLTLWDMAPSTIHEIANGKKLYLKGLPSNPYSYSDKTTVIDMILGEFAFTGEGELYISDIIFRNITGDPEAWTYLNLNCHKIELTACTFDNLSQDAANTLWFGQERLPANGIYGQINNCIFKNSWLWINTDLEINTQYNTFISSYIELDNGHGSNLAYGANLTLSNNIFDGWYAEEEGAIIYQPGITYSRRLQFKLFDNNLFSNFTNGKIIYNYSKTDWEYLGQAGPALSNNIIINSDASSCNSGLDIHLVPKNYSFAVDAGMPDANISRDYYYKVLPKDYQGAAPKKRRNDIGAAEYLGNPRALQIIAPTQNINAIVPRPSTYSYQVDANIFYDEAGCRLNVQKQNKYSFSIVDNRLTAGLTMPAGIVANSNGRITWNVGNTTPINSYDFKVRLSENANAANFIETPVFTLNVAGRPILGEITPNIIKPQDARQVTIPVSNENPNILDRSIYTWSLAWPKSVVNPATAQSKVTLNTSTGVVQIASDFYSVSGVTFEVTAKTTYNVEATRRYTLIVMPPYVPMAIMDCGCGVVDAPKTCAISIYKDASLSQIPANLAVNSKIYFNLTKDLVPGVTLSSDYVMATATGQISFTFTKVPATGGGYPDRIELVINGTTYEFLEDRYIYFNYRAEGADKVMEKDYHKLVLRFRKGIGDCAANCP